MRENHRVILASSSLNEALLKLNSSYEMFAIYIEQIKYTNSAGERKSLSYECMKIEWPDEQSGAAFWKEAYDKPLTNRLPFHERTLRDIHCVALANKSRKATVKQLGITEATLRFHLRKLRCVNAQEQSQNLTYSLLVTQWLDEASGLAFWKELYDRPIQQANLKTITVCEMHRAILASENIDDLLKEQGISAVQLNSYFKKLVYINPERDCDEVSYQWIKANCPNEQAGADLWGVAYHKPVNAMRITLHQQTVRHIFRVLLKSTSFNEMAQKLQSHPTTVRKHLTQLLGSVSDGQYNSLSFEEIKRGWPNEESVMQTWGERYDQPFSAIRVDLLGKTMREVYQIILASGSLHQAAGALGVSSARLQETLGRLHVIDKEGNKVFLSYDWIRKWLRDEHFGEQYWPAAYDKTLAELITVCSERTLHDVHGAILVCESVHDAAQKLGVKEAILRDYLLQLLDSDEDDQADVSALFDQIKKQWPDEASAAEFWGEAYYEHALTAHVLPLSQKTLREVHLAALDSKTLWGAAKKLQTCGSSLRAYVAKLPYVNQQPLTYELMKSNWPDEQSARAFWGASYDEIRAPSIMQLSNKRICEIHAAILDSRTISIAAGNLGVRESTLTSFLGHLRYIDRKGNIRPLSYTLMKTLWRNAGVGAACWGEAYYRASTIYNVDLTCITIRNFHRAILGSSSIASAAGCFGVCEATFRAHLGRAVYTNANGKEDYLSYKRMKELWPTEQAAADFWQQAYDKPFILSKISLGQRTLRYIHRVILPSTSLNDAAVNLGANGTRLLEHLATLSYIDKHGQSHPLSYDVLKNHWLSEADGEQYLGDVYDKPLKGVNSLKRSMEEVVIPSHGEQAPVRTLEQYPENELGELGRELSRSCYKSKSPRLTLFSPANRTDQAELENQAESEFDSWFNSVINYP